MEQPILIPATRARELSQKNGITVEAVIGMVNNACHDGRVTARFFDVYFPFDVMQKVLELGYSVSKAKGLVGEDVTLISW